MDGFIRSASADQPTGEQDVKTAAAPDAVKTHRQRGGGQEQSECWANEAAGQVIFSANDRIQRLSLTTPP